MNGRLDTLQAAILLAKFGVFDDEIQARQDVAQTYTELLEDADGIETPKIPDGYRSAWAQYSVLANDESMRSSFQSALKSAGVPTAVYYPRPLHLQTAFHHLGFSEGDFPTSEDCASRIFSLPMHPYLDRDEQEMITRILLSVDRNDGG
jgi:dTDP-4-amino-4,6-dideoxygalactose transaminase